ncbi:MAG: tetratricopeptide repeat protein, partial [Gemmatimonadales bacterium]
RASAELLRRASEADSAGRLAEALERYERVLDADPLHIEARVAVARLLERTDRPDLALAVLDDGLARQPDQTELLLARGRAHGQQRRYPAAEADLRRVLRLYPSHGPAHFELGLILMRRGRAADGADAFARAIAFGPESASVYTHLAEALNLSGRLTDAAAALERAVALDPAEPRAYHLLGRVLDRLQRSDEATAMYRRARELAGQ